MNKRHTTLRAQLRALHRDEAGTAMTEFTICLPVWIFIMMGVASLGQMGAHITKVQIIAQKRLWVNATHASSNDIPQHMSSVAAAATTGPLIMESRLPGTQNATLNAGYALVTVGLGTRAHWGESAALTTPLRALGAPAAKLITKDAIGDRKYAIRAMDDGLTMEAINAMGGGGGGGTPSITGIIADIGFAALSASGSLHAVSAGIRYGNVKGELVNQTLQLKPAGSISAGARYDTLVPPRPLTGASAKFIPFGVSRLIAETEKNYAVALNFGKSEWDGSSGSNPHGGIDEGKIGETEQGAQQACNDCRNQISSRNSQCNNDPQNCPPMPECAAGMSGC